MGERSYISYPQENAERRKAEATHLQQLVAMLEGSHTYYTQEQDDKYANGVRDAMKEESC